MTIDKKTIEAMKDAGVSFVGTIATPGGGRTIGIAPDEVAEFVADKIGFSAKQFGVTKELYREWVESDGTVQCSANTTSGHRCKNFMSGFIQQEMADWLKMRGGYCAVHGGEGTRKSE